MSEQIKCKSENYIINEDFGSGVSSSTDKYLFGELFAPNVRVIEDLNLKTYLIKILYLTNENTNIEKVTLEKYEEVKTSESVFSSEFIKLTNSQIVFDLKIFLKSQDASKPGKNNITQIVIDGKASETLKEYFNNPNAVLHTEIIPVEGLPNFSRTPGRPIDPYPPIIPPKNS